MAHGSYSFSNEERVNCRSESWFFFFFFWFIMDEGVNVSGIALAEAGRLKQARAGTVVFGKQGKESEALKRGMG